MPDTNVARTRRKRTGPPPGRLVLLVLGLVLAGTAVSSAAPPAVTITSAPDATTTATSAEFAFSVSEGATVTCTLDGVVTDPCASPLRSGELAVGRHTFEVTATLDGEPATAGLTWEVVAPPPADVVPPTVTLDPSPAATNAPRFTFTSDEPATFSCSLDGAAPEPCTSPFVPVGPLEDGEHTLAVAATDAAGNVGAAATRVWVLDTVAPAPPKVDVERDAPIPTFTFAAEEPGVSFECGLERVLTREPPALTPCAGSKRSYADLGAGTYAFTVVGTDAAGNLSPPAVRAWTRPTAAFEVSPATPLVGEPVALRSTSNDMEHPLSLALAWTLDGHPLGDTELVRHAFAAPGEHMIGLRVTDADGAQDVAFRTLVVRPRPAQAAEASPSPGDDPVPGRTAPGGDPLPGRTAPGGDALPSTIAPTGGSPAPVSPPTPPPPARPALTSPFPIVRVAGEVFRAHTRIRLLTVLAPRGSRLELRCRGRRCPFRRIRATVRTRGSRPTALLRVRRAEGMRLQAGLVLEIRVTRPGQVGKYTRFRIRGGGRVPDRVDRCLRPGSSRPVSCPA
jgi:hypothetical protein